MMCLKRSSVDLLTGHKWNHENSLERDNVESRLNQNDSLSQKCLQISLSFKNFCGALEDFFAD